MRPKTSGSRSFVFQHVLYALLHQFDDMPAVVFAVDNSRQFPVAQAGGFPEQVANPA